MRRRAASFFITIVLVCGVAPADAVQCDCSRKIGTCTPGASWIGNSNWIEFTSSSQQCSLILYRLGDAYGNTFTVIGGRERDEFQKLPGKARPEVQAYN